MASAESVSAAQYSKTLLAPPPQILIIAFSGCVTENFSWGFPKYFSMIAKKVRNLHLFDKKSKKNIHAYPNFFPCN